MLRKGRAQDGAVRLLAAVFVVVCAAFVLFPFFVMISISLQTMSEVYSPSMVLVPERLQFVNYAKAMRNGNWPRYFLNSAIVTVVVTAVSLVINSMAGYVFARLRFRGSKVLFLLVLTGMMIPPQVTMIPLFSLLRGIPFAGGNNWLGQGGVGLYNTYAGLILPFLAGSFGVFLCRQFYIGFPRELDDAARMDGCGPFAAFLKIYLPLSGPVLASLGVLKFTGTWNEYTWPLIMTNTDKMKTVQLALTVFRNESEILWNQLMAATFLVSLAIYVVFTFAQKYFVAGLLSGSVKG